VPAAAVIPARLVYIKIVVIKKFVVENWEERFVLGERGRILFFSSLHSLIGKGNQLV
jgi:hypothetical protein